MKFTWLLSLLLDSGWTDKIRKSERLFACFFINQYFLVGYDDGQPVKQPNDVKTFHNVQNKTGIFMAIETQC